MTNTNIKVKRSRKNKKSITEKYMMVESTSDLLYDTFDKQIIINSLIKECDLKENEALDIANKVENILIKSDLKIITSSFIRSLTNQILSENNPDKWLKYSALTIPLYDAKSMIEDRNVENSNACFSTASINSTMGEQIHKQLAIREYFNKKSAEAHKKGECHIHDIGKFSSPYCSGNSIEYLKKYGLRLPEISPSTPAAHANTLVNHMQCFASFLRTQFNGAIGFADVNIAFAPFLVDKSYDEIKQVAQHLIFSFAQLASGSDICFSDFNLYLDIPKHIAESNAIGPKGKPTGKKYKEYAKEAKLFLKAILEVAMVGDADGGNFRFPKLDVHIDEKSFQPENDELMDLICNLNSKRGSAYILYDRGNTVKISECPVSGDETVLSIHKQYDIPIIRKIKGFNDNEIYDIYSEGKFIKGKFNKYENQDMFEISLTSKHKIKTTKNHLNLCLLKNKDNYFETDITTENIKELLNNKNEVWLPFSNSILEGCGGNYELGYIIGAFAGDGSITDNNTIIFCLSEGFKDTVKDKLIEYVTKYFGGNNSINKAKDSLGYFLRFSSSALYGYCSEFVTGSKRTRAYTDKIFSMSKEFRQGILDGHHDTDGSSKQSRIYTSSIAMVNKLICLSATMGKLTSINVDNRTAGTGKLSNEPIYCVLVYKNNMDKYRNIYMKMFNKTWIRATNVEDLKVKETAYCFEVLNGKPYFTLMNSGVLTHNCRLSLEITGEELERMIAHPEEARFSALQNCTINLPRIAYKSKKIEDIKKEIDRLVNIAINAHIDKFNHLQNVLKVKDGALKFLASGMDGKPYLRMNEAKFLIGMCGLNEMVKIISGFNLHDNEEALKLGLEIIAYLNLSMEKQSKENNINCILEETPAESTAGRFALLDLKYYYDQAKHYVNGNIEKGEVYYTNSVHLAYNANVDILTRIEKQSKFASMIKAGSIIHNWFGDKEPDPKALKELYKTTLLNTNAVQTADSPDMTVCKDCHNTFKGLNDICPSCGSNNIYNTTRITGYFSQISGWTKSKLAELKDRTKVDFSMQQFENVEFNNDEQILFFQKPHCEKCETVKKQLAGKLNENVKILDTHEYKGLALASYYNVDELPCLMKVKGSQIISKLSGAGSYLKWLKDNMK